MFWRIFRQLLSASRGRLLLALVTLSSGAAICSALLNINLDAEQKLTREFRSLGANVVIAPPVTGADAPLMDAGVMTRIALLRDARIVAAAPYLYVAANAGQQRVILAGTWFDQIAKTNSWWKVEGSWISNRDDGRHCLVGSTAARQLGLKPGSSIELRAGNQASRLTVSGIISAGGTEDSQIFASLDVAQALSGLTNQISLVQLGVAGSSSQIESAVAQLAAALPALSVRPVRQIATAQGAILRRIRGMIFWTIALILALTTLGVLASMAALAMERSRDVGLMKALGGSLPRIMLLFLTEAGALGAAGGTIGFVAGAILARWIGSRVFDVAISPRVIVFPITILLSVAVALAGAAPLRLLGRVRPADILRGE